MKIPKISNTQLLIEQMTPHIGQRCHIITYTTTLLNLQVMYFWHLRLLVLLRHINGGLSNVTFLLLFIFINWWTSPQPYLSLWEAGTSGSV